MLKAFALIATFHGQAYVLDHDMSGEDCIAAVYEQQEKLLVDLDGTNLVLTTRTIFSCEAQ